MKTLDQGEEKVKKLCDALRRETLEPAELEAGELLEKAQRQAVELIERARKEAADLEEAARKRIEQERAVFQTSLEQGCKQSLELLRQAIEQGLLRDQLFQEITSATAAPDIVSRLIEVILKGLEREGIEADLSAIVAASVDPDTVNRHLGRELIERLREGGVEVGGFHGGVQIVLHGEKITLDITDEALLELLGRFLRRDFRDMLFRVAG